MPTKFVKGDLFAEGFKALAHGCNCGGAMGKGIAVEFRKRFPEMYAEYKERCADGRFKLGDCFVWTEKDFTVFNLGTQRHWRAKAKLPDIEKSVKAMVQQAEHAGVQRIGLPKIGAGLGALPWDQVRSILTAAGALTSVELVVFEEFQAR